MKKSTKKTAAPTSEPETATQQIDARIQDLGDWRGEVLSHIRTLIRQAVPDVVEEIKWRKPTNPLGVPVWSHHGILCTGETYKSHVKLTFAQGASLPDPCGLFNQDGTVRRAIDIRQGDTLNADAFGTLVRAAAALNSSKGK